VPNSRLRRARAALLLGPLCTLAACAGRRGPAGDASAAGAPAGGPRATAARPGAADRDTSSTAIGGGKTIERLFAGRFPGVTVTPSRGGGLQIRIRGGANSFMAGEEPLYVIDGTPVPAGTGGIVSVNPYDIEKIEVLKNPADIGLYGVRGANGVIRITTIRPGR
jgi:TonB-dependent SusC/RagA subfamily outer membrane receptor